MKKILLSAVYLIFAASAFAQSDTTSNSPWYFDFTFGVNQSKMSGTEVDFMQSIVTNHGDGELVIKSRTGVDLGFLIGRRLGNPRLCWCCVRE